MIKRALKDKFLRDNLVLFIGTMAAAVVNYLYHPVLSRLLTVEDFGEVQALLSLFGNLLILLGIFSTNVINIIANGHHKDETDFRERMVLITKLKKLALIFSFALFLLIVIFSSQLQAFFKFDSLYPFISLAAILLISVSNFFRKAYLRGKERFKETSVIQVMESSGRLVFAVVFVLLGWRAFGAITGIVAAQLFVLYYVYRITRDEFKYAKGTPLKIDSSVKKELRFGLLIFTVSMTITALSTLDVLVVKHYFSPEQAGLYSGIATIARIVLYVTGSVAAVLLPAVKMRNTPLQNQRLLFKSMLLVAALGGFALLVFVTAPEFMIKILIGSQYLKYQFLLPKLGLLMLLIALLSPVFSYYMALRRYFIGAFGAVGVISIAILSYFNHQTPEMIVYQFMIGVGIIYFLLMLKVLHSVFRYKLYVRG